MPVRDKAEPMSYCDICGEEWASVCCCCGEVFCPEHSILVQIQHKYKETQRLVCKNCLHSKSVVLITMIRSGIRPQNWQPNHYEETAEDIRWFLLEGESKE